jgi:type IV pilus assembly protein PilB
LRKKEKLGKMLRDAGLVTEEQLMLALKAQRETKMRLGQLLIRQGIMTESQLADSLARQLGIERYHPDKYPVNPDLSRSIPDETVQKYRVIPLGKSGKSLKIGIADPMDIAAIDEIEAITNLDIEPVICTEHEIGQLMAAIYRGSSDLDDVLENIRMKGEGADQWPEPVQAVEDVDVSSIREGADEAPVVKLINSILSKAIRDKASDIHISPEKDNVQLRFRMDGRLYDVPAPPKSMFLHIVSRIKVLAQMDISISRIPQDGRFTVQIEDKEVNIRASSIPTIYGENIVLRLLDMSSSVYSLDALGMDKADIRKIESMIQKPHGMILSTGPTGSGKTTSLYAILKEINKPDINIISLEDPVEYRMDNVRQVQLNRKAGMTFASGLRSVLRQDPDVIMVGEIRDPETATIAVQAALTGHRVLSTVHTNDAAGAITRFLDMGIEPFLVSSVMLVSFAQRLVRKLCHECRKPYSPPRELLAAWGLERLQGTLYNRGKGCLNCRNTGYKGRTGIFEVLIIDEMVQSMILQRRSAREITRAAKEAGILRTLKEDAAQKVADGITSLEEAAFAVID